MDVLRLVEQGLSNSGTAEKLFVSAKAVDRHVASIVAKLNAYKWGEAVADARRLRLLDDVYVSPATALAGSPRRSSVWEMAGVEAHASVAGRFCCRNDRFRESTVHALSPEPNGHEHPLHLAEAIAQVAQ